MVLRTTIITALVLTLLATASFAGGPGGMRAWWSDSDVVKGLSLTVDEQGKLKDMQYNMRIKGIDAKGAKDKARLAIKNLLTQKTLNEAEINKQVEIIAKSETTLSKARTGFFVGVRKLLGYERFMKLETLYKNMRGKRGVPGKGGKRGAGGPGQGSGPVSMRGGPGQGQMGGGFMQP